jgi:hypothetical protein
MAFDENAKDKKAFLSQNPEMSSHISGRAPLANKI